MNGIDPNTRHSARRDASWWHRLSCRSLRPVAFRHLSAMTMMQMMERDGAGFHDPISVRQMIEMIDAGEGELIANRTAVAFVLRHGAGEGVEIRALLVAPGCRRRGAGSALVAKLKARHPEEHLFCTFREERWTKFAQRAGFAGHQLVNGSWHVTTNLASLDDAMDSVADRSSHSVGRAQDPGVPHGRRSRPSLQKGVRVLLRLLLR